MEHKDLATVLKELGVYRLIIEPKSETSCFYEGQQTVVSQEGMCQSTTLRARTLDNFIAAASSFFDAPHKSKNKQD